MPINPLPDDTVRVLGSTAGISTPVGLVKELLENALDAGSSSIEILVSENTVDRIEVRDNGNGVHPDDYDHLGRPGHTSKLRSLEELRTIGATTLGFRGQALASANTLGNVIVTTRTRQDPTAVSLALRRGVGGVESQERTPAPVGTAVSVTALFGRIPVREQVITKKAKKHIVDIKQLLRAYALARPNVRLFFKVIGGGPKLSWSYSPPPEANVKEAVIQLFGTGVMSQCLLQTMTSQMDFENKVFHDGLKFVIEAVIPKPDADLTKLSKGSFFSIDSRPITTSYGTGRILLDAFKTQFKKIRRSDDELKTLKDSFIRVNLQCPPGTYDPNIEPAKDDVLFSDEPQITTLFERLCTDAYRDRSAFETIERRPLICRTQTHTPPPSSDGPEVIDGSITSSLKDRTGSETIRPPQKLMSSRSSPLLPEPMRTDTSPTLGPQASERARDNSFCSSEIKPLLSSAVVRNSNVQDILRSSIAQPIHSPIGDDSARNVNMDCSGMEMEDVRSGQIESATNSVTPQDGREEILYHSTATLDQKRKRTFVVDMATDPDMSSDEEAEMLACRFRDLRDTDSQPHYTNNDPMEGLDPWVITKMTAPTRQPLAHASIQMDISQSPNHPQGLASLSGNGYAFEELPVLRPPGGPPGDLDSSSIRRLGISPVGSRDTQIISHSSTMARRGVSQVTTRPADHNIPWSPLHPESLNEKRNLPNLRAHHNDWEERIDPDGLVQTTLSFEGSRAKKKAPNKQTQMNIIDVLEKADPPFRIHKKLKTQGRHPPTGDDVPSHGSFGSKRIDIGHIDKHPGNFLREDLLVRSSQSPSLAAVRSQEGCLAQQPRVPIPDTGDAGDECGNRDPRLYLMRRQRSEEKHRGQGRQTIKRAKTEMLPLESIPQGHEIQHLVLKVEPVTEKLEQIRIADIQDEAINDQELWDTIGLKDVAEIEERIRQVMSVWTEKTLGEKTEVEINLGKVVKGKGVAT
ncbi:hypothetical protein VPNG_03752 [Cytospora leucostoma]|uniref:DNA mismatch repair protein S5 domain-containing protein n=1 Tax=Cytospora leucostoma TaxID=1230097 RepID=A0A423XF70_9PEZI|nr:hypothetical protein VPNG_03752 [Cytospora leucostoma]